jgi:glycosyltransferase involved in cell wall biosynthesis
MNLVMFGGPTAWNAAWYSRHQLTVALARRHRVVLVGEPLDVRAALRRPRSFLSAGGLADDQFGVRRYAHPGWLPDIYRSNVLRRMFNALRLRALERALRRSGYAPAIHYVWHPDFQPAVEGVDRGRLVYHAYDRYDRYSGAQADVQERERRLVRQAALCIAASAEIGAHLGAMGARDVTVLRHGVDHAMFRPGLDPAPGLEDVAHPRLGIVASFTDAVDVETLRRIADRRPGWSLVLVGNATFTVDAKRLAFEAMCRLPNVHYIGFRPRTEVPAWIAGFDVALACYDLETWAPHIQPLKMNEYLACGVPVVASDIAASRELGDLVARASGLDHWIGEIERALRDDGPAARARRVLFAGDSSWDHRASELEIVLERLVSGAGPISAG